MVNNLLEVISIKADGQYYEAVTCAQINSSNRQPGIISQITFIARKGTWKIGDAIKINLPEKGN